MIVYVKVKDTGLVYAGWKDVEVTQSLDDASSSFSMNTADVDVKVNKGDLIQIYADKSLLFTGYVDRVEETYNATSHDIQISGRSKTKDLVDCSATPREWAVPTKASVILNQLTEPYGVRVLIAEDVMVPFFSVQKDSTETIMSAIHRLSDQLKLMVTDNANGDLVLTRAGTTLSKNFILSRLNDTRSNVLMANHVDDESELFSEVIVRSQMRGSDTNFGTTAQQIQASAKDDKNIKRKRIMIIDAGEPLTQSQAQDLANWQIGYNSGKSVSLQYTVPDWFHVGGLWQLNTQVRSTDDFFGVDDTFLITRLRFSKSNTSGTTTDITLNPVSAYIPAPKAATLPTKGVRKAKKGSGNKKPESISFEEWNKQNS